MTNSPRRQGWSWEARLRVRNATLALAVIHALGILTLSADAQTMTAIYTFSGPPDGATPQAGLLQDGVGNLYGTTFFGGHACNPLGCGVVFKLDSRGKETILHTFSGYPSDGANPAGGLISDASGNLYGTTQTGGLSNYGTVFKVNKKGGTAVLHSFDGIDGKYPYGALVLDDVGNLYGTTSSGGSSSHGTIFKLDTARKETVLHNFRGYPRDGSRPMAGLLRDAEGNLYGTTAAGGSSYYGTVFKLDSSGKETVLHSFNGADGANPQAGLIGDGNGNLYGTTQEGGIGQCFPLGCGVVFKVDAAGRETILYRFEGVSDGDSPVAALLRDAQGGLYGTTQYGGGPLKCNSGCGTLFRVDKAGKETLSFSFGSETCERGTFPAAGLIRDTAGNFYGTTAYGGCSTYGTVFKFTP
jgi:uncharacterized repeat protein (TIGR03803 family)